MMHERTKTEQTISIISPWKLRPSW